MPTRTKAKRLSTIWTQHLKGQAQRKALEEVLRNQLHLQVIDRLKQIIDLKLESLTTNLDYSNPAWAFDQASRNGSEKTLKEIKDLITV